MWFSGLYEVRLTNNEVEKVRIVENERTSVRKGNSDRKILSAYLCFYSTAGQTNEK